MLTRTDTSGTTLFEWDGMDCVRETAPSTGSAIYDTSTYDGSAEYGSGGMTQYYVVNGALRQLVRDNAAYAVVCDALGNVRLVLDDTGATVSSFQYDAWGNVLASSYDNLPGGLAYRFVGGLGCRWDGGTGLTYMRARWYDGAVLQRFVSRDPLSWPITRPALAENDEESGKPMGAVRKTKSSNSAVNAYAYVTNRPVNFVDPRGLWSIVWETCINVYSYVGFVDGVPITICEYECRMSGTAWELPVPCDLGACPPYVVMPTFYW